MQHFLLGHLRDLPQVDRVVELVVDLEKWRKLMHLEVVGGSELLDLAEREGRGGGSVVVKVLYKLIVTPETLRSSCCQSFTATKYLPSNTALYTVSNRDAFMV